MAEQPIDLWLALMSVFPYLLLAAGVSGIFIAAFKRRHGRKDTKTPVICPHCHKTVLPWPWKNQQSSRWLCPECGQSLDDLA